MNEARTYRRVRPPSVEHRWQKGNTAQLTQEQRDEIEARIRAHRARVEAELARMNEAKERIK